jgi:electron transport complex protein RnfB
MLPIPETPDNWRWKYPIIPIKALAFNIGEVSA